MAKTKIEWTDTTWNPVRGCSHVSPGCANCYAERMASRFSGQGMPYEGLAVLQPKPHWTGRVELVEEKLHDPYRWRKPRRIFVNSMSDLFHENLSFEQIDRVWRAMLDNPQHTYQVLTKRADRILEYMTSDTEGGIAAYGTPPSWIHLGVSVENQEWADKRIPLLLKTPAASRFISYEPALGPLDLMYPTGCNPEQFCCPGITNDCDCRGMPYNPPLLYYLDWVIAGGESGPGARPAHPDWFRTVRDQCVAAKVPFFFKKWGAWEPRWGGETHLVYRDGRCRQGCHEEPDAWRERLAEPMRRNPRGKAGCENTGRLLDGREWNQFPAEVTE